MTCPPNCKGARPHGGTPTDPDSLEICGCAPAPLSRPEPIDTWVASSRPDADRSLKIDVAHGRTRVRLYEATREVGLGRGATIGEACANALNSIMARQEEAAAESDECDAVFVRRQTLLGVAPVAAGSAPTPTRPTPVPQDGSRYSLVAEPRARRSHPPGASVAHHVQTRVI